MFISSCYFIFTTRRDSAAEKEFNIVIHMTLEHVLIQRLKKKNWTKKITFNKDINFTKWANFSRRMFIYDMKQTLKGFLSPLKSLNIGVVFRT